MPSLEFEFPPPLPTIAAVAGTDIRENIECSGGTTTVVGWSTQINIGGEPFHLANGPASSYYEIVADAKGNIMSLNGHTRSTSDDFTAVTSSGQQPSGTWFWFSFPMGGTAAFRANCVGPLITSNALTLNGTPLGISPSAVTITSTGTTCLVPC